MDRRTFLSLTAGLSAASVLPGTIGASFAETKPDHLTVMTWGGLWGDAIQKSVADPFTQKTGVPVIEDRGSSPVQRITKLKVGLDEQAFDLVQLHDGLFPLAEAQGVLEPIDKSSPRLTNLPHVYPQFVHDQWVAQIYSAIGIAYNSKEIETPPTSFADLWKEEYRGRIVLPEIAHSIGTYIIPIGAIAGGKKPTDLEAGFQQFRKMVDLEPIFVGDTDSIMNAFATGEAVIGLLYKSQTMTVQRRNKAVEWVFPEEGAIAISWGTGIAKNTPNKALAEEFLNLTLAPQGQIALTQAFNYPGTNKKALDLLDPDQRQAVELTDAQRDSLIQLDHKFMNDHRTEIVDRWNRIVAGQ
ncbi:PotD/PotF family extracellular solute-binding protein [Jiella sp. M17.18]|uniref:ABC transporter substrate-binding protein n=1 Tax=Jiella sp. M17.18 TaxID=3234247 RepID=UPI0034DF9E2E